MHFIKITLAFRKKKKLDKPYFLIFFDVYFLEWLVYFISNMLARTKNKTKQKFPRTAYKNTQACRKMSGGLGHDYAHPGNQSVL